MTEIILARHGQTAWNMSEIFRGRIDIDLDEVGLKQVALLGEHLADRKIEAVYSSPLTRALKTAAAIAKPHNLEVQIAQGLIDFDFGEWEGLSVPEVEKRYPDCFREWAKTPHLVRIPGGDCLNDVTVRSMAVVEEAIRKHKDTVVLVSHRVVCRILMLAMLGLDNSHFWNIRQDTASITIFDYVNGRYILSQHNDTSYLKPLKGEKLKGF